MEGRYGRCEVERIKWIDEGKGCEVMSLLSSTFIYRFSPGVAGIANQASGSKSDAAMMVEDQRAATERNMKFEGDAHTR